RSDRLRRHPKLAECLEAPVKVLDSRRKISLLVRATAEGVALARDPSKIVLGLTPREEFLVNYLSVSNSTLDEKHVGHHVSCAEITFGFPESCIARGTLCKQRGGFVEFASAVMNPRPSMLYAGVPQRCTGRLRKLAISLVERFQRRSKLPQCHECIGPLLPC